MEINCDSCGQNYEVTPEHAGMEFECSKCQATITVPANLFVSDSPQTTVPPATPPAKDESARNELDSANCPKCGSVLKPGAILCIECGHNLKLGMNAKTVATAKKAGSFGIAVAIAAGTAVISALIWAGIAIAINMEIGYVAWGIGLAVGGSVIVMTDERSARLGTVAVMLAIGAIFLGKILYVSYGLDKAIKKEIKNDPEALADILFFDMVRKNEFDAKYLEWLKENGENKQEALGNAPKDMQKLIQTEDDKFEARLKSLKPEEKERLYQAGAEQWLASISYSDRLKSTCSFWDILWILLAISSAWKMASGEESAHA